jgi:hypothetical protein
MTAGLGGSAARERRRKLKEEFWPDAAAWLGPEESGYFCAPRSLPYILQALSSKDVSGDRGPGRVYLELLSSHHGQGVVEMTHEDEHSYGAGYTSGRASRTWKDRMKVLEEAGFIQVTSSGRKYSKVLLVHPSVAMQRLRDQNKISDQLWQAYRSRQIEVKERTTEELPAPKPTKRAAKKTSPPARVK